jgi:ArsR family transcriptional regulator
MVTRDGLELQAKLLRALAHPVRLHILDILAQQEACVCHLTAAMNRPQPYISQQLATLRDVGLVTDHRQGTLIYYRIADDRIISWLRQGRELVRGPDDRSVSFPTVPDKTVVNCPCPRCREQEP